MDSRNNILSLLGLALRGGNLVMGEEPVEAVARAKDARLLLLASDAAENTRRRVSHFADHGACIWIQVPFTKAELGQQLGRSAVAVAAVTDIGLASAVTQRLAQLDPKQYGAASERLQLKAKRAAQRRAEQQAHEKNLRQGKKRVKKDSPAAPAEQTPAETKPAEKKPAGRRPAEGRPTAGKPVAGERPKRSASRPSKENRPKPRAKANPYANSRPVKKGKGSFRKKES